MHAPTADRDVYYQVLIRNITIRILMISIIIFLLDRAAIASVSFTLSRHFVKHIVNTNRKNEAVNQEMPESGKLVTIGELAPGIVHKSGNPAVIMAEEAGLINNFLEEETGMIPAQRNLTTFP